MTNHSAYYGGNPKDKPLTESQIYQLGVEAEENAAPVVVSSYLDTANDYVVYLCQECFQADESAADLEYMDRAADGDICAGCGNACGEPRAEL